MGPATLGPKAGAPGSIIFTNSALLVPIDNDLEVPDFGAATDIKDPRIH